jgi:hypothetical protein
MRVAAPVAVASTVTVFVPTVPLQTTSARTIPSSPVAEAGSVGEIIDVAIDTDENVAEDLETGTLYVLHGELLYRYEPPAVPSTEDE